MSFSGRFGIPQLASGHNPTAGKGKQMTEFVKLISLSLIVCHDGAILTKISKDYLKKHTGAWSPSHECMTELLAIAIALAQCVYYSTELVHYADNLGTILI